MQREARFIPASHRLLSILVGLSCASCNSESGPERVSALPESGVALQAVEKALNTWQADPSAERTTTSIQPIMFVEQQQPPAQRLTHFRILGETPGYEDEGYRRILVRLSLEEPDDSVLATYYVFGQDPVWVYRSEDFDMIMHMDKSMMPAPPPVAHESPSEPGDGEEVGSASHDLPPTSEGFAGTVGSDKSP